MMRRVYRSPTGLQRRIWRSHRKNPKLNSEREQPTGTSGWAFGRIGNGYIALAATQGLDFQKRGDNAYRELRSQDTPDIWLCRIGRAAVDGKNFNRFIKKVLALPIKFEGTQVELTTLRGNQPDFGWQGPLLVNSTAQPLSGFKHYDNPYCTCEMGAPEIEIRYRMDALRLHFKENPEKEPNSHP